MPVDHVIFPVGNGSLIIGALKGFQELVQAGKLAEMPALHCVQAEAIRPIVAAINGEDWTVAADATTVASGISVASPPRLSQVAEAVRETGGQGVTVDEASIIAWQNRLAMTEGIFGEATSAVAFAGLERLIADGVISADQKVVVPVTGSGLKEPLPEQVREE
jgi:threonine synthase